MVAKALTKYSVLGDSPSIKISNAVVESWLLEKLSSIVGELVRLQQTPLAVIIVLPSESISTPVVAVFVVILETGKVFKRICPATVVKLTSSP